MSQTFSRQLFVNLPVRDLPKSIEFFRKLGFTFDPQFTDASATCMVVGDGCFVMLLAESRFRDFTKKPICDATRHTEAIFAVRLETRAEVDTMVRQALAVGGSPSMDATDHGFMYASSFQDLDGHLWEVFQMDVSAMPKAT